MNVLSLFDGMSCGMIALERAGIEVDNYFASEIDKYAIQVSKYNYPNIIQLGDITNWKEWELPKIDLIIGGSPCQGFSRQGVGLNFEDPRSKLFFEFVDILKHYKPRYFLLENVDMKKEWQDVITKYLEVEPVKINSDLFLPQNRPRTYWTNIEIPIVKKVNYSILSLLENVNLKDFEAIDGIKVCSTFSEKSKQLISFVDGELRIKQSVKKGYAVAEEGDGINISFPTSKSRRGRVIKGRSSCLDTSCNFGVYHNNTIRRFTINELEKLQGLPSGYTQILSERHAKKVIGNGWTVDVIAHIFKGL